MDLFVQQHKQGASAFRGLLFIKRAQEFAPGIVDKNVYGDVLGTLKPGDITDFVLQHHATVRNPKYPHYDLRLGTKDTNLFSWAVPKADMPPPGEMRRPLPQTQLHTYQYGSFEGKIPHGYGAGTVTMADKGKAIITRVTPNTLHFTLGHTRVPTRYVLVHTKGRDGKMWQIIAQPTPGVVPGVGEKPVYKQISAVDQDDAIAQATQLQEKIDGAHGILNIGEKGEADIYSVRPSVAGKPISHTERMGMFGIRVPIKYRRSAFRGEMYFKDQSGKAVPFKETSGLLNMLPAKSIETQRERGLVPQVALFDAIQHQGKRLDGTPLSERQQLVRELLQELPEEIFHEPQTVTTPEEKQKLVEEIRTGKNPRTSEGVMAIMPDDKIMKIKNKLEATGYLTGTYPGIGKRKGTAGGLTFVTDRENKNAPEGRVGTGFTDQELAEIVANLQEYLGKPIRIEHMGQFGSGKLRAPSFKGFETDKTAAVVPRGLAKLRSMIVGVSHAHGRPIVAVQLKPNVQQLFYRSRHGTDGKVPNTWYPFFGLTPKDHRGTEWFIKGTLDQLTQGHGIKPIQRTMKQLNTLPEFQGVQEDIISNMRKMPKFMPANSLLRSAVWKSRVPVFNEGSQVHDYIRLMTERLRDPETAAWVTRMPNVGRNMALYGIEPGTSLKTHIRDQILKLKFFDALAKSRRSSPVVKHAASIPPKVLQAIISKNHDALAIYARHGGAVSQMRRALAKARAAALNPQPVQLKLWPDGVHPAPTIKQSAPTQYLTTIFRNSLAGTLSKMRKFGPVGRASARMGTKNKLGMGLGWIAGHVPAAAGYVINPALGAALSPIPFGFLTAPAGAAIQQGIRNISKAPVSELAAKSKQYIQPLIKPGSAELIKDAIIRRKGKGFALYSHKGKILGHHKSRASAMRQERAIMAHKYGESKSTQAPTSVGLHFMTQDGTIKASALVEVADTPELRRRGLSNRKSLNENSGMFFDKAGVYWMKDVEFPLDLVFVDKEGTVLEKRSMPVEIFGYRPSWLETTLYAPSSSDAAHAIELPAGWCDKHSIKAGDRVSATGVNKC